MSVSRKTIGIVLAVVGVLAAGAAIFLVINSKQENSTATQCTTSTWRPSPPDVGATLPSGIVVSVNKEGPDPLGGGVYTICVK